MQSNTPHRRSHLSCHSQEFSWLEQLAERERTGRDLGDHAVGIGDDAAYLPIDSPGVVIATDTLLAGTHFDSAASPEQIGHKAVAVNLSDLAAMAAVPQAATVAISVPENTDVAWLDALLRGLQQTAHSFGVSVVGGDTTSWSGPLAITVTVVGVPGPKGVVTRSGGSPGDQIYVTGPLGGSLAGHHLAFVPRVDEALAITEKFDVTAMIDLSDGLASDLRHLSTASNCGAVIDADRVPTRDGLPDGEELQHALCDGEDFELLIAIRGSVVTDPMLIPIGELTKSSTISIREHGTTRSLDELGYSHSINSPKT